MGENINNKKKKKKSKNKKYDAKIWHRFLLKTNEKTFEVMTENEQEKLNWTLLIGAAISRLQPLENASPNNSKLDGLKSPTLEVPNGDADEDEMSIMRDEHYAPYWIPDETTNQCSCC